MREMRSRLKVLNNGIDRKIETSGYQDEIRCMKGCAHCCRMLVLASPVEMVAALQYALDTDREWVYDTVWPRIVEQNELFSKEFMPTEARGNDAITAQKWFDAQIKCAFLKDDDTCGIYEYRPVMCRTFVVVSDPENCKPPSDKEVVHIELEGLPEVMRFYELLAEREDLPWQLAPLPVATNWAAVAMEGGTAFLRTKLSGSIFENDVAAMHHWSRRLGFEVKTVASRNHSKTSIDSR